MTSQKLCCFGLSLILALALVACRSARSTQLIDGFHGYESIPEARDYLAKISPHQPWKDDHRPVDPSDRRPSHDFVYLSGDFHHLGSDGNLRLTFHNRRLMSTEFSTSDGRMYMEALRKSGFPLPPAPDKRVTVNKGTTFSYQADPRGTFHFVWENSALAKEWSDWIAKYS
jgi:hypothetical protein